MEQNGHTVTADAGILRAMMQWTRSRLAGSLGSMKQGKRDVDAILGYKQALTYQDFVDRYLRQDIAARLVGIFPEATWGIPPTLAEAPPEGVEEDPERPPTPFEEAWSALTERLQLFLLLERADLLARLGHYSVMLLGLQGQADLQAPAAPVRSPEDLLYLQLYSEESATIEAFEENAALASYRQPTLYRITTDGGPLNTTARLSRQVLVHASRVIHVPGESLLEDDIYGIPALEKVYNNLDDLLMVRGGAAYGWWQDAKRRFVLALREGYTMTAEDTANLTREAEEFDLLKNFLRVQGMDVLPVRGEAANPSAHFEMLLDLILAAAGIPRRVFMDTGSGEQAVHENAQERKWLSQITRRQVKYAEVRLLRPLTDRLLRLQALPAPQTRYLVRWENLLSLSEQQQAEIARNVATAISTFAGPGMSQTVMSNEQFVEEYLGVPFTGQEIADVVGLAPADEGEIEEDNVEEAVPAEDTDDEAAD